MRTTTDLRRLFDDLVRFETGLWDAVDARLRSELELPLVNFDPMQVIARTSPCRVHDVASQLAITVGGASKAVDRIEAAGHCARRANPDDRRSQIVELTPSGERLLDAAGAVFEEELRARVGSVLSATELDQLGDALARLRAAGTGAPS